MSMSEREEEAEVAVETLLWTCKECYVYQIPPLKNESGHRANDCERTISTRTPHHPLASIRLSDERTSHASWIAGDVNKWLWSGTIQVKAKGNVLYVLLVDTTTGELFATCPVTEPGSKAIDPVVDSSRYFVLRIDDGKGRHAFIGMGFRDRKCARLQPRAPPSVKRRRGGGGGGGCA